MGDRLLSGTNIPAQFRDVRFDDFDVRRRNGNRSLLRQIDDWEPSEAKPGLVMQGPPAVGKTMLGCALCNEYHAEMPYSKVNSETARTHLRQERLPVYFIQLAELVSLQIRSFKLYDAVMKGIRDPQEWNELDQLLQDLRNRVQVLIIDDVGKEHRTPSDYAADEFDLLVRTRHNAGLTTVYTTNIPVRRWSNLYSDSMTSFIERSSEVVVF